MSDSSDSFGAYLAGRLAGKLSASVEAQGELDRERRIAVRAIEIGKEYEAELKEHLINAQVNRMAELSYFFARGEILKRLNKEAQLIGAHFAKYGNMSEGEFQTLAPLMNERRIEDGNQRLENIAAFESAARAYLETDEAWNLLIGYGLTEADCNRILGRAREKIEADLAS